jgi:hypothetical protein
MIERGLGPTGGELHRLSARDRRGKHLGELDGGLRQRVELRPLLDLRLNGDHRRVAVAEQHRARSKDVVEVLISVTVEDVAADTV